MADVSFTHVPAEGFAGFGMQLAAGEWSSIDVSNVLGATGRLEKPVTEASPFVFFKVQLSMAVDNMVMVLESTGGARGYDDIWDNLQKRFSGLIQLAQASMNPAEKAAGDRLFTTLLLGKGGSQTRLSYQQEVDFGRKQIRLASEPTLTADITLLGLSGLVANIATATENLASAIGQGRNDLAPAKQRRASVAECMQVFGTVYRSLDWIAAYGAPGGEREKARALLESLQDLATKYPARAAKTKAPAVLKPTVGTEAALPG